MQKELPFDMEQTLVSISEKHELFQQFGSKVLETPLRTLAGMLPIEGNIENKRKTAFRKIISMFPNETLMRNHLVSLDFTPTKWFKKGVTHENVGKFPGGPTTFNIDEAASLFSLPWGVASSVGDAFSWKVSLHESPAFPIHWVVNLYMYYTLLHELGHVFTLPAIYSVWRAREKKGITSFEDQKATYMLKIGKEMVSGEDYTESFVDLIRKHGPFGGYTSDYKEETDRDTWLKESWADAIAAHYLGFMLYPERNFEPLHPEVDTYLQKFFSAEATITW